MASLLDITMLSYFAEIFIFIFVFVLVYALLKMTKVLGNDQGLLGLISIAVAALFMFSEKAINMITFMIPWFVLMGVFIFLVILNYRIMGGEGGVMQILIDSNKHKTVVYWIIIVGVMVVLMGLGNEYGQTVGPYLPSEGSDSGSVDGTYRNASSPIERISGIGDNQRGTGDVATDDFATNLGATLFHPKVLGMVLILVIGSFTLMFMVKG